MTLLQRVLSPIVEVRKEETVGLASMFAYSFLAMTAYNILKPVTRSAFIKDLGADNLPYVLLVSGLIIGVLMTGYSWIIARLPRRSALSYLNYHRHFGHRFVLAGEKDGARPPPAE